MEQKDSHTNCKDFVTVCYKDCNRPLFCPNPDCFYLQEYTRENVIQFDKKGSCGICGTNGVFNTWEARKYTTFKGNTAHIFHVGSHTYIPKDIFKWPSETVSKALSIDPNSK